VRELDRDLLALVDDVVVGDDVAGRIDDEARAHRLRAEGLTAAAIAAAAIAAAAIPAATAATALAVIVSTTAELTEEIAEGRGDVVETRNLIARRFAIHDHGHDRRAHMLHEVREAEGHALLEQARRRGRRSLRLRHGGNRSQTFLRQLREIQS